MDGKIKSINMEITRLFKKEDELYHRYSTFCGFSDPTMWVLYTICGAAENQTYTQNDLVSMWCYPKQTVNYAVSGLVKNGLVKLEQLPGVRNGKAVCLTEEGRCVCEEKIFPLIEAENRSIKRMTEEERMLLLKLTDMQCKYFEEEITKVMEGES